MNFIERRNNLSSSLSPDQITIDRIWRESVHQLTDLSAALPIFLGGAAFRVGRLGFVNIAQKIGLNSNIYLAGSAWGFALGAEVASYELSHRIIKGGTLDWSGDQGLKNGFWNSAISFASLRGFGHLFRQQNILFQHFTQDTAVVLGQDVAAFAGFVSPNFLPYAQRFMEAEIMNNQMMASMGLYGHIFPSLIRSERKWDIMSQVQFPATKIAFTLPAQNLLFTSSAEGSGTAAPRLDPLIAKQAVEFIDWYTERSGPSKPMDIVSRLQAFKKAYEEGGSHLHSFRASRIAIEILSQLRRMQQLFGNDAFIIEQTKKFFDFWDMQGNHPHAELRFSPKAKTPSPVKYAESDRRVWKDLEKDLNLTTQALEKGEDAEEIYAKRADENLVNRIWFHQLIHFAQEVGARVRLLSPESLVNSFQYDDSQLPDTTLRQALQKLRARNLDEAAFQVMELTIPYGEVVFGKEDPYVDKAFLSYFLNIMQSRLKGSAHFVDTLEPLHAPIFIRIPSPSLMEALLHEVAPHNAPRFIYVNGEITRASMMRARSMGLGAIGVVPQNINFGDLNVTVPPWIFSIHDIFHAYMSASTSPVFKDFVGRHYQSLAQQTWVKSPIGEYYLGQLVDMSFSEEAFFTGSLRFISSHLEARVERSDITKDDFNRAIDFLTQYEKFVRDQEAQNPADAHFYQELKSGIKAWKSNIEFQQKAFRWTGTLGLQVVNLFGRRFR